jgi:hypothetical protein
VQLKLHKNNCENNICNCDLIKSVESYKYLGVLIDSKLKWNTHINHIFKKILPMLAVSYKLKHLLNKSTLKTFYHSLIESRFSYGVTFWGGSYPTHKKALNKLIKKIQKKLSISDKVLNLQQLFFKRSCIYFYKKQFSQNQLPHNNLRNKNIPSIRPNLEVTRHQSVYTTLKLFNSLPNSLKLEKTLRKFKISLNDHVTKNSNITDIINVYKS